MSKEVTFTNDDLIKYAFSKITEGPNEGNFHCVMCLESAKQCRRPYKANSGYGNLWNHLKCSDHKDLYCDFISRKKGIAESGVMKGPMDLYVIEATPTAKKLHAWMRLIIEKLQPLSICDDEVYRDFSKYGETSTKTILKYLLMLENEVKRKISSILPEEFGIIIDGWSDGMSGHYVAIIATFCVALNNPREVLLEINKLPDLTNQNSLNHETFIKQVLSKYGRDETALQFLIADNTNLNPSIARNLNTHFIGCYSHKYNLAMQYFSTRFKKALEK